MLEKGFTFHNACIVCEGIFVALLIGSAHVDPKYWMDFFSTAIVFFFLGGICLWIDEFAHGE